MLFLRRSAFLFVYAVCGTGAAPARADLADVECSQTGDQPCMVTATSLPLRLLVKPQSNVYIQMDESSGQERSNVPPFESTMLLKCATCPTTTISRLRGGSASAQTEQPHRIHAGGRRGALEAGAGPGVHQSGAYGAQARPDVRLLGCAGFDLQEIEAASGRAEQLYQEVLGGDVPAEIVSREGNAWVDIEQTFI